jgi:phage N-6-adenine-methyltransferase
MHPEPLDTFAEPRPGLAFLRHHAGVQDGEHPFDLCGIRPVAGGPRPDVLQHVRRDGRRGGRIDGDKVGIELVGRMALRERGEVGEVVRIAGHRPPARRRDEIDAPGIEAPLVELQPTPVMEDVNHPRRTSAEACHERYTTAMSTLTRRPQGDLAHFHPQREAQTIAALDTVAQHWAKAKNAEKLLAALMEKLARQAAFVMWWDQYAEKDKGGRPTKTRGRSAAGTHAGKDGVPDSKTLARWRAKLSTPDQFEATAAALCARYPQLVELQTTAHVSQRSGDTEWFTPQRYVDAARQVLGTIDLDPASTTAANAVVQATTFYTKEMDGLRLDWRGTVWLNPPFTKPLIEPFLQRLVEAHLTGAVPAAVVLVNNATETRWFHVVAEASDAVCFPQGRIAFWHPDKGHGPPLQGQACLYLGPDVRAFRQAFTDLGMVWVR